MNWLSIFIDKSGVGLYRDEGLAAIDNTNGPKIDRIRKDFIVLIREEGLLITIERNIIETEFLDDKETLSFSSTTFLTTYLQSSNTCLK